MKRIWILFFVLFSSILKSQDISESKSISDYRQKNDKACHAFKSLKNYIENKPVKNFSWKPWTYNQKFGSERVEIISENGEAEMVNMESISDYWLSDEYGLLLRPYLRQYYTVVVRGSYCYYIKLGFGEVDKNDDGVLEFSLSKNFNKMFEYYSEGIDGDLKIWSDKKFESWLKDYKLIEDYKAETPKKDLTDDEWRYKSRIINHRIKFLKKLNKLKKLETKE